MLRDPAILILDEATSSIDPYTDLLIRKAMKVLLKNRTSIIIAHRLSTVRDADRILVIDNGRIVEEGSHRELMRKGGLYQHLYEMQFKEPVKAVVKPEVLPKIAPMKIASKDPKRNPETSMEKQSDSTEKPK